VSVELDLGPEVAYTGLREGTPVYDPTGERVGVVEEVVEDMGIFEGVVVHTYPLPGRHVFADAEQIASLHERGVLLSVGRDALREPRERGGGGDDHTVAESPLQARLRRLWDWLTGHR
jgi:hypothetical protein